ncbi:isoprenyl transferase [Ammoniphilus oxalaticus]|uniref:Isoprenyl transferase n=1 Tax=Ammoniphilus oxalaticus TaxID=66863 RepID=A0A419SL59_9BACL|nr:isoprenyl transferase [Ammoniphilus oxalaticus]RKD24689.1 isoprenyl transferase [Ammoniphilus oxalaticus]
MLNRFSKWIQGQESESFPLDLDKIPSHIAIIMDGNGRWARKRGLPRVAGHRAGMRTVREITRAASDLGVKYLTLYAFSTENWKRPKDEVEFLMRLPQEYLLTELEELIEQNVQVRMLGKQEQLPNDTLDAVYQAQERTKENTGLILNFALNYGSRDELLHAIQQIASEAQSGNLNPEDITAQALNRFLYTAGMPDPDLLIRTSGELRLSNFMLWQLAYAEMFFCEVLWPDFSKEEFYKAISEYQHRNRRYGAL